MAQYDGAIRIVTKITTKDAEESLASLEWTIKKSAKYMDELRSKMDALKDQKIPTQEYKDLQKELSDTEKKFSELLDEKKKIESSGLDLPVDSKLSKELGAAEERIYDLKSAMASLEDSGKAYTLGQDTAQYKAYERQIQYEEAAIAKAGEHYKALLSDEKHLSEIKEKSTVSDQKMVELMEERGRLASKLTELESAGVTEGYKEYDETYIAWKNATNAVKEYQAQLNKKTEAGQAKEAEKAAREADREFERQRRIAEQAEKNLQKENARIQKEADNEAKLQAKEEERRRKEEARINAIQAKEEEKRAREAAAIQAEIAEEERLAQIRDNSVVGSQRIVEAAERRRQLLQEIADMESAGIGAGYQQYDDAKREIASIEQEIKEYNNGIEETKENYRKLSDVAKQSLGRLGQSMKKSGGMMSTLASRFKGLTLSLLVFNQISKAFNAMISSMKQGFGNLYKEAGGFKSAVDGLKASSLTLKNSFAAAFRPLAEFAIPYIQKTMDAISGLMSVIGRFMAVITGQKTYTKAIKQTTAAIEGQTKAQNKQLSSLDKMNNLSSAGSGGGGADSTGMFEEIPVDAKVPSYFEKIAEYVKMLKDIFSQGFWDGLGDWENRWQSVKDSIISIKDSLIAIWTDPAVSSGADSWIKSVSYALGSLAGSVAGIGLTIGTNLVGGIAQYLEENSGRIKEYLVSVFDIGTGINNTIVELSQAIAHIFEAFASPEGIQLTANIFGILLDTLMGISEIALKVSGDILNIFTEPVIDNAERFKTAIEGILGFLSSIAGTVKRGIDDTFDKLNEVYVTHIKPFFESVANGLSELVGRFLDFWNGSVRPMLDEWAVKFDALWQEHIQPMLNKFMELFGKVADLLKTVWENVLKPLIDWIIKNVLPVLLPIIDGIVKAVMEVAGVIADVVGGIIDVIGGIIQFLTDVFSGDWGKAWDGITGIFEGVKDTIKNIINGILGAVEALCNGVIKGINVVIGALNNLHFDIPDWIPGAGGKSFGFDIPALREISIPRLARGAVIPANREFLAVLGDQKSGRNLEAPEDLLRKIVREESGDGGVKELTIRIPIEYDGNLLFEIIRKLDLEQWNRTGRPSFQM